MTLSLKINKKTKLKTLKVTNTTCFNFPKYLLSLLSIATLIQGCGLFSNYKVINKNDFARVNYSQNPINTGKLSVSADKNDGWLDPISAVTYWAKKHSLSPDNSQVAVSYSQSLRQIGSYQKASSIMNKVFLKDNSPSLNATLEIIKILAGTGRSAEAIKYGQMALRLDHLNWEAQTLYAVTLDQIGDNKEAQKHYSIALKLSPGNPQILNNLGLSYAITGRLEKAEQALREALSSHKSTAKVRQNLALIVALKGDLDEAERLARSDLPPETSAVAIAYLRKLATKEDYWGELTTNNQPVVHTSSFANDAPQNKFIPAPSARPHTDVQTNSLPLIPSKNRANQHKKRKKLNRSQPRSQPRSTYSPKINSRKQATNLIPRPSTQPSNSTRSNLASFKQGDDAFVVQDYLNPSKRSPYNQGYPEAENARQASKKRW